MLRPLLLAGGIAFALGIVHATPLRSILTDVQRWKSWIDDRGFAAHAVFTLTGMAAVSVGVPRLALAAASGLLFGFAQGCLLAMLIAIAGSWGAYHFARWGGSRWAQETLRRRPGLAARLRHPGIADIFLLRQLPLPGLVPNLLCGLLKVPQRTFLIGSSIGFLPGTIAITLIGSSLGKDSLEKSLGQIAAAMLALGIAGWLVMKWVRRRRLPG